MARVSVVTDSTCDIPVEIVRDLGITVVPLNVHFGTTTYRDGVDITAEEFYQKLVSFSGMPTTSQPSVGAFQDVYRELAAGGSEIISIHISQKLSGTYASALAAAQSLPDLRIEVVDSKFASIALGLMVIAAAEASRQGKGLAELTRLIHEAIPRTHLYVVMDTLEYLRRGGRIGKASALIGTLLSIKPVLAVKDGEIHPVEKVRTKAHALRRLIELTRQHGGIAKLAMAHSAALDEAEQVARELSTLVPRRDIIMANVGAVVGTHVGPGVVGTCFMVR